jgi:uncharacterized protein
MTPAPFFVEDIMKMKSFFIIAFMLAFASHSQAQSPSFDCGKASTIVEKTICKDLELSGMDSEVAYYFSSARKFRATDKKAADYVLRNQRDWLKERNKCANSKNIDYCLKESYQDRIFELKFSAPYNTSGESSLPTGAYGKLDEGSEEEIIIGCDKFECTISASSVNLARFSTCEFYAKIALSAFSSRVKSKRPVRVVETGSQGEAQYMEISFVDGGAVINDHASTEDPDYKGYGCGMGASFSLNEKFAKK